MGLFNDQKNVTNIDSFGCLDENNKPSEFDENVIDLVFILDKSGSMHDLVEDTIGGYNSYIEKESDVSLSFKYNYSIAGIRKIKDRINAKIKELK